jgi:hypothetical protein
MEVLAKMSVLLGIISSALGAIAWYRASIKKEYAAEQFEREIARNVVELDRGLREIEAKIETNNLILIEIKSYLLAKRGGDTNG